jgi:hypothetical protein
MKFIKLYTDEQSTDPRVIRNFSGYSPIVRTQGMSYVFLSVNGYPRILIYL